MNPTHIVLNYGIHLWGGGRNCGLKEGDKCPYLPRVCEFLTTEHTYKVIWQTAPPKQDIGNTLTECVHLPSCLAQVSCMKTSQPLL
jgi:hypothetical protein